MFIIGPKGCIYCPLKDSVPKAIPGMVFGTRVLKWAVYGPFAGYGIWPNFYGSCGPWGTSCLSADDASLIAGMVEAKSYF